MKIQKFQRRPFFVEAVQVAEDNLREVADWCSGSLEQTVREQIPYVKVDVLNPQTPRQTRAFVGDWVLRSTKGWKVYTHKPFARYFEEQVSDEVHSGQEVLNVFAADEDDVVSA